MNLYIFFIWRWMQQLRLEFELSTLIPHSRPIPTTSSAHPQYKMRNTEILTYLKSYKVYSVLWYFENFSFPNIAKFIESNDVYWIYVQLKRIHPQAAFLKVGCAESVKKNVNTSDSLNSALLPLLKRSNEIHSGDLLAMVRHNSNTKDLFNMIDINFDLSFERMLIKPLLKFM